MKANIPELMNRYHLYTKAEPHCGYHILRQWADKINKHFVFTSNVDGMFERAGFAPEQIIECHGSIHFVQYRDARQFGTDVVPASATTLPSLHVDEYFRAQGELPKINGRPARPNILMFGDWGFVETRLQKQEDRHEAFFESLPASAKVVVVEVGAGKAVPTVRYTSESVLERFPSARLIRINVDEPENRRQPKQTIEVPAGGKSALEAINQELGRLGA